MISPHEFGKYIADKVNSLQLGYFYMDGAEPQSAWQGITGQWIVYSLEKSLGFNRTVDLCAAVERTWRGFSRKKVENRAEKRTQAVALAAELWLSNIIAEVKAKEAVAAKLADA